MKQEDLQRLYDDNEAMNEQRSADHARQVAPTEPPPERELIRVRFGGNPGSVATYSGETPRRYLVRLERKVIDPDNPDVGPVSSRWITADELETD